MHTPKPTPPALQEPSYEGMVTITLEGSGFSIREDVSRLIALQIVAYIDSIKPKS